jgi:hypothetical protein
MSNIVRAVNAMLLNPDKITIAEKGKGDCFFFYYDKKYLWSVGTWYDENDNTGVTYLRYYGSGDLLKNPDLKKSSGPGGYVEYTANTEDTPEAYTTFTRIYTLVKEMFFDVGAALDEIMKTAPGPLDLASITARTTTNLLTTRKKE